MYQFIKIFQRQSHIKSLVSMSVLAMFLLSFSVSGFAASSGAIVVTIKPLYSLVAQLTAGIEEPVLLMKTIQSPHHYNMRPSERRLLSDAKMIVWLGPNLESYLAKIIKQQDQAAVVTAIQAEDLVLLEERGRDKHDHHGDDEHSSHKQRGGFAGTDKLDPHIWLSTRNAVAISRQVAEQLIALDPGNKSRYQANLDRLVQRIEDLASSLATTFEDTDQPYIAYHDAFQYFEHENGLNHVGSISFDEETSSSLKHLREISDSIEQNDVRCLVYQPPEPAIIGTLVDHTSANAVALDPLGLEAQDPAEAWFEIMQTMAADLHQCLISK